MKVKGKPWKECERCLRIANKVSVNMLDKEGPGISKEIKALRGMKAVDYGVNYQQWMLMCEICGSDYFVTIDNEDGAWEFNIERRKNDNPVIYKAPVTKDDFTDEYDFEALGKASELKIFMKSGEVHHIAVMDYWPCGDRTGDYLNGIGLTKAPIERTKYGGNNSRTEFMIPSPEIDHIEILAAGDTPNHGSHPEYPFSPDSLDDLYIKE
ncbi:hypothetical protein HOI83_01895 [Candidatus Uhrbacteria bacterium]|jgi:hypothetical protein|nr:hypothetical protein [Candidatus Uhrbacteria bacterium]